MANETVVLAVILGAHGVRGDVRIKSFTSDPADCFSYGALKSRDGAIALNAKSARVTSKGIVVTPDTHREREEWQALKGTELCVDRDKLPPPDDDEFYIEDLVGLIVYDQTSGNRVGSIKAVHDFGAGDILEITPDQGKKTLMVPMTEEDVPSISLTDRRVTVADLDFWAADPKASPEDQAEL